MSRSPMTAPFFPHPDSAMRLLVLILRNFKVHNDRRYMIDCGRIRPCGPAKRNPWEICWWVGWMCVYMVYLDLCKKKVFLMFFGVYRFFPVNYSVSRECGPNKTARSILEVKITSETGPLHTKGGDMWWHGKRIGANQRLFMFNHMIHI